MVPLANDTDPPLSRNQHQPSRGIETDVDLPVGPLFVVEININPVEGLKH